MTRFVQHFLTLAAAVGNGRFWVADVAARNPWQRVWLHPGSIFSMRRARRT